MPETNDSEEQAFQGALNGITRYFSSTFSDEQMQKMIDEALKFSVPTSPLIDAIDAHTDLVIENMYHRIYFYRHWLHWLHMHGQHANWGGRIKL